MATRKQKVKAKSKKPLVKKTAPRKAKAKAKAKAKTVQRKKVSPLPRKARKGRAEAFEEATTLQIAVAEIMGDIEERMALDRIGQ